MPQIAITGHRKLIDKNEVRKNISLSLMYFQEIYKQDLEAVSALAEGADTIFAQEAQNAQIPTKFVLPFALDEYKKDFSENGIEELENLIEKNNNKFEVVGSLKNHTKTERNEAYLAVGKKIVDDADIVLAVWDGKPAKGTGGTGDIVEYAKNKGKAVHIIEGIREENLYKTEAQQKFKQ